MCVKDEGKISWSSWEEFSPCFTFKKKGVPCVASQDFVFLLYLS